MLRFAVAFALRGARKLVRGLREGLDEEERYRVADDVVARLQQHGDPWRLSDELPPDDRQGIFYAAAGRISDRIAFAAPIDFTPAD